LAGNPPTKEAMNVSFFCLNVANSVQLEKGVAMTKLTDVQATCETAADAIATLEMSQWPGWIGYILEALDDVKTERLEGEFEYHLAKMRDMLNTRILEGRW
jgi:hypothetical protein